jgi:transposase
VNTRTGLPVDIRIREAIIRAFHDEKRTYSQIAALLGIGEATVSRVLRLHRETAGVAPRPRGGGNRSPIHGRIADLLERIVSRMPDATVVELTAALSKAADIDTSRASVQRALARLGYSRKKRPSLPSSGTRPSGRRTGASTARG